MRSSLLLACAVSSLAWLSGCTLSPTPDGADAEATSSTATAIVVVERSAGPGDAVRDDAVVARFVRTRQGGVDDAALRLAGVAQELPPLGQCTATFAPSSAPTAGARELDLLDVGPFSLEEAPHAYPRASQADARRTLLLPRLMPDPTGIVSGVFYSARSPEIFAPASRLQLRAAGGRDLAEGFLVNVVAPNDVGDVHVLSSGVGLDVTWDGEADARDVAYVDVLSAMRSATLVIRCASADVGHLVVPALDLGNVEEGQVVVHRLHRESFRAKGIEPGEVRFDLSRAVTFRR